MGKLSGKSAIVTGASKGIGAAIARALANEGAAVVVNYSSSREGADKVVAEITGKGGRAIAVQADVGKAADVQRLFGVAKETFGPIDILVNNAGVYQFDALEQVSDTEFHRQFGANVLGPLLATQAALPQFGNKGGTVINVSSIASEKSMPAASVYSASKAAVDAITRSLAAELGPRGVRVNTIAPGPVVTEGFHAAGMAGSDMAKQMAAGTPLGRLGEPDDIAKVAVFLASDDSAWVTGERITVSGGF